MTAPTSNENADWAWHPRLPIENSPLFSWPPRLSEAIRYLLGQGFLLSRVPLYAALAVVSWLFLLPPVAQWGEFEFGWIARVYALNLGSTILVAGGLHLYLHVCKRQGDEHRFDSRELSRSHPRFLASNQVLDNMVWTCVSGVTVWTAFEVIVMWAHANGVAPWLSWSDSPVLFGLMFLLLAFWSSTHFYWTHRLLHCKPMYRRVHSLHHKNVNTGPWSGMAMHPLEHLLYLSSIFIHLMVASHPIHMLYHMYMQALGPLFTHSGYGDLVIKQRPIIELGDFHHQLHHRYFDCNYGTSVVPWDEWMGSFHDGTPEATRRMQQRQFEKRSSLAGSL